MNKHLIKFTLSLLQKETLTKKDIENLLYYCDGNIHDFKDSLLAFNYADANVFKDTDILEKGIEYAKDYGWSIANIEFKGR